MINNMISISLDGKPCVSESYSVLFIYNSIHLILVRVERKSLIRKTLILIRVPFVSGTVCGLHLGSPDNDSPAGRDFRGEAGGGVRDDTPRSEEHTSELQSRPHLVCRLLL